MKSESREVFIDTNFFMIPFQFNVDIVEEFKRILPNYKLGKPLNYKEFKKHEYELFDLLKLVWGCMWW